MAAARPPPSEAPSSQCLSLQACQPLAAAGPGEVQLLAPGSPFEAHEDADDDEEDDALAIDQGNQPVLCGDPACPSMGFD